MAPRMREWRFLAEDMIGYCENILALTKGVDQDHLIKKDPMTYEVILHDISFLGARVALLPKILREKYTNVDWSALAKSGDDLITYYWCVDDEAVWKLIQEDIPKVLKTLQKMLKETKKGPMLVPKESQQGKPLKSSSVKRKEVLKILREHKEILKERFGITKLQLFGSYSRDEAVEGSDVDLLAHFDEDLEYNKDFGNPYTLYNKAQDYIEELLGLKVDLVPHKKMRTEMRSHVEKEVISI